MKIKLKWKLFYAAFVKLFNKLFQLNYIFHIFPVYLFENNQQ